MKAISFVVRGLITQWTKQCLESIRTHFPGQEIVLSTWDTENLTNLTYDTLVISNNQQNEFAGQPIINQQIITASKGLQKVSNDYSICLRSDMVFSSSTLSNIKIIDNKRQHKLSIFKEPILISSLNTMNPFGPINLPFHPSDRYHFGLTSDLLDFWSIPLFQSHQPRLRPEQYFLLENLKKKGHNFILQQDYDNNIYHNYITYQFLLNNFAIIDDDMLNIICAKYPKNYPHFPTFISYDLFCLLKNII